MHVCMQVHVHTCKRMSVTPEIFVLGSSERGHMYTTCGVFMNVCGNVHLVPVCISEWSVVHTHDHVHACFYKCHALVISYLECMPDWPLPVQ